MPRKLKKPPNRRDIDMLAGSKAAPALVDRAERGERSPRSTGNSRDGNIGSLNVFISYSHKDDDLRRQLEVRLKPLQRNGVIACWHDRLIAAGHEWEKQISANLEQADLILLLVSADFIASDYCYDIEMTRALERHEAGEALVIPVIVRDVDWSDAPFGKLQALPRYGKAVRRWSDRDSAWRSVVEGIKAAAAELRRTRS